MLTTREKKSCYESTAISITVIESLSELQQHRQQIDRLSSVPFLKCSWMFPWIDTYCDSSCKLKFLIATDGDSNLIGFAPLVLRNSLKRGNHFCFVGSGKACADYMTFPALPNQKTAFLESLADWFLCCDGWDRIELDGAATEDATLKEFAEQLGRRGFRADQIPTLSAWRMELPDSWEDLLSGLSKNSRKKYRRQTRALEGKSELKRATDMASLEEGFGILESLHTARWESLGEAGCFAHPGFREFLFGMAKEKLESNALSLIWMTVEGKPIAADIAFYSEEGAFTYQGGISPDHLDLEPGRAILKSQIELAMERGCRFMDFLRGDEPYKARFQATEIENSRHEIVHSSTRARILDSILQVGRSVKSLLG